MTGSTERPFAPPRAAAAAPGVVLASLPRRLIGRLIDIAIMAGFSSLGFAMFTGQWGCTCAPGGNGFGLLGGGFGMLFALGVQCFMIATRAQSIGKFVVGTMMIDREGRPVGFVRGVLLRELPLVWFRIAASPLQVIAALDIGFILREDRRCLHDHFAGTRVVDVE